ncbi:MAG TPA: hypothetical protein PLX50_00720 [Candidatus Aminicenantes bacterium]|nr:hypothetical protein [Candidatus Aminicenantes bacterium]
MRHLKKTRILLGLCPFKAWRASLVRRHLEECAVCREDLADVRQARSVTIAGSELGPVKDFWPQFAESLRTKAPAKTKVARPAWRWAIGTAGLAGIAVLTFLILGPRQRTNGLDSGVKLRVNYAELYEKPAQAIIFQTQEADSTFVWVERQN